MRNALGAVAALLLASAAATPAVAQNSADTRASTFSLAGGISLPQGDGLTVVSAEGDVEADAGWYVAGGLLVRPTAIPVALRLEALYTRFGFADFSVTQPGGSFTADARASIFGGTVNVIAGPAEGAAFRPYVIGGVGLYNVSKETDFDVTGGGQSGSFGLTEDETAFGVNGGAGLEFMLGSLRSFVEARYHFVLTDFADGETGEDGQRTSFVPIVIGLRF